MRIWRKQKTKKGQFLSAVQYNHSPARAYYNNPPSLLYKATDDRKMGLLYEFLVRRSIGSCEPLYIGK